MDSGVSWRTLNGTHCPKKVWLVRKWILLKELYRINKDVNVAFTHFVLFACDAGTVQCIQREK